MKTTALQLPRTAMMQKHLLAQQPVVVQLQMQTQVIGKLPTRRQLTDRRARRTRTAWMTRVRSAADAADVHPGKLPL